MTSETQASLNTDSAMQRAHVKGWKEGEPLSVDLVYGDARKVGQVFLKQRTFMTRLLRGGVAFLLGLIPTFFVATIPMLHFILVPVFLLLSLLLASRIASERTVLLGGFGKCPACDSDFEVTTAAAKFPIKDLCPICKRHIRIEKTSVTTSDNYPDENA